MNFMVESERLLIRPFEVADTEEYYQMTRDPLIRKYVPFACENTLEETLNTIDMYYSHGDCVYDFYLVLEEKSTHKLVGAIIATATKTYPLTLDVCILTEPSVRRKGFMFEALTAFKSALPKSTELLFVVDKKNEASLNTVTKLPGIVEKTFSRPQKETMYLFSVTT